MGQEGLASRADLKQASLRQAGVSRYDATPGVNRARQWPDTLGVRSCPAWSAHIDGQSSSPEVNRSVNPHDDINSIYRPSMLGGLPGWRPRR